MSERLTGLVGAFSERRVECEAAIEQLSDHSVDRARSIEMLRRRFDGELADLVIAAARLQPKARLKLGAGVWWVTQRSLQQATAWQVAQLKSRWFGDRLVYDLCCGIGGDAIQLARRGPLVAVDCDPTMVAMAAANLTHRGAQPAQAGLTNPEPTALAAGVQSGVNQPPRPEASAYGSVEKTDLSGQPQAVVRYHDACQLKIPPSSAIHIDPDRRIDRGRTTRPDQFQPSWSRVLEMIAGSPSAIVKLAPATKVADADATARHRCWISLQGTVREQSLLQGEAIERAGVVESSKSAVSLDAAGAACWFVPENLVADRGEVATKPQSWLIDPDPSIRAAGLSETFARQHGFTLLGAPSGFLTCDQVERVTPEAAAMAVVGNVVWSGACDDRKLRRELRLRGFYPGTVKIRGTDHDPAKLVKRYRGCGDQPITLWIGRAADRVFAAFTK